MSSTLSDRDTWRPASRYPDPAVMSLDPRFNKYKLPLASVERLATGCRWSAVAIPCPSTIWFQSSACVSCLLIERIEVSLALLYAGSDMRLQVRLLDFVNFRQGSAGFHY